MFRSPQPNSLPPRFSSHFSSRHLLLYARLNIVFQKQQLRSSSSKLDGQADYGALVEENQRLSQQLDEQRAAQQEVQALLRKTYQLELQAFTLRKEKAEHDRAVAEQEYDKIMSKKRGLFGSLRLAHDRVRGCCAVREISRS